MINTGPFLLDVQGPGTMQCTDCMGDDCGKWLSMQCVCMHMGKWDYAHSLSTSLWRGRRGGWARWVQQTMQQPRQLSQETVGYFFTGYMQWTSIHHVTDRQLLTLINCYYTTTTPVGISTHTLQPRLNDVSWWGSDDIKQIVPPPHWLIMFPCTTYLSDQTMSDRQRQLTLVSYLPVLGCNQGVYKMFLRRHILGKLLASLFLIAFGLLSVVSHWWGVKYYLHPTMAHVAELYLSVPTMSGQSDYRF